MRQSETWLKFHFWPISTHPFDVCKWCWKDVKNFHFNDVCWTFKRCVKIMLQKFHFEHCKNVSKMAIVNFKKTLKKTSQKRSLETLEVYHVNIENLSKKEFHSGLYWMSSECLTNTLIVVFWTGLCSVGNIFYFSSVSVSVLSHPGHGKSRCCIVGNWTCLSFLKTFHLSSKRLLQFLQSC